MQLPTTPVVNGTKQAKVEELAQSVTQTSTTLNDVLKGNVTVETPADSEDPQFLVNGNPFSVLDIISPKELEEAQRLYNGPFKNIRGENRANIATLGMDALVNMKDITDKALRRAKQRDLDKVNGPGKDLLKEVEKGLTLDLVYRDLSWWQKNKYLHPLVVFIRNSESLLRKTDRLGANLLTGQGILIERKADFLTMKKNYKLQVTKLYSAAAAAEMSLAREIEYREDLKKKAAKNPGNTRYGEEINEQQTVVSRLRRRTFFLLGEALNSYLRVNVIEESIKAVEIAEDAVVEAMFGALEDLKQSLTIILGQWDTAEQADFARQVGQVRRAANRKLVDVIGVANNILEALTEDQKADIELYIATKDKLVAQIKWGIELDKKLAENYQLLGKTTKKVTKDVENALAQLEGDDAE